MRQQLFNALLPSALLALGVTACGTQSSTEPTTAGGPTDEPGASAPNGPAIDDVAQPATVGRFDTAAAQPLAYPVRIAVTADNTVFLSDSVGNQVVGYKEGHVTQAIVGLDRPLGLAIHGDFLYVGNAGRKNVEIYSLTESRFVRALPAEIVMPNAIAVASDGSVYVTDSKRDVVKAFDADGRALEDIGATGSADGQFRFPSGVAVDDTRVVVGDQGNHRVQIFDRQGDFQRAFGSELQSARSTEDLRNHFTRIGGVALRGDEILVVESVHAYVQVFDQNGESKGLFGRAGVCGSCTKMPLDVALDAQGRALATDPEQRRWVALSTEMR